MIVDDSKVVRMVARKILEGLGFSVIEASDGKDALDKCGTAMPDGLLLDWYMPEMNGLEVLSGVRSLPGGEDVRVVFCSSESDVARIGEALDAGADEYIMKPFDGEIISAKFQEVGLI